MTRVSQSIMVCIATLSLVTTDVIEAQTATMFGFTNSGAGCASVLRLDLGSNTVDVGATFRGWYGADGSNNGRIATSNYIASRTGTDALRNNWFQFDLSNLTGQTIFGASLLLDNPVSELCNSANALPVRLTQVGFSSPNATETFSLFDVSATLSSLGVANGVGLFNDLSSGMLFGSRTVSSADNGTVVSIDLNNDALFALSSARGSSIAFGGTIAPVQVPEPSTFALLASGIIALGVVARRRRRA